MDERELIKSKIDIVDFISSYIPLKKTGRNFRSRCPFHNEKTPSFTVSPERQIFKCFGCGKAGDIFGFLMEYEKMGFGEAIRFLAEKAGVKLEFQGKGKSPYQKEESDTLFEINHLASEFYHFVLTNTDFGKPAREYLKRRGITNESINLFKIGYAPRSWESLSRFLLKKGYKAEDLVKAGVAVKRIYNSEFRIKNEKEEGNVKDRFYGRLMFPLFDHRGNCVGFAGRVFEKKDEEKVKAGLIGKYINTSETPVYHKSEVLFGFNVTKDYVKKENYAIIVEGEIDLIKAFQAGTKNIAAIKGSALTEGQVLLLKRYTENLKICLDSDLAGQMAAMRGISVAEKAGLNIKIVELLFGKDPDECVSKDIKLWKKSLGGARDVWQFYIDFALKQFDVKDTFGKKKFTEFVFPKIDEISNLVVRDSYIKKLASVLQVSEEVVVRQMEEMEKKHKIKNYKTRDTVNDYKNKKGRREMLEENLLSLILQSDDAGKYLNNILENSEKAEKKENAREMTDGFIRFKTPVLKKIFDRLLEFIKTNVFTIQNFVQNLPAELQDKTDELYLKDLGFPNLLEVVEKELKRTFLEIRKLDLIEERNEISQQMAKADEEGDEFASLNEKLKKVNKKLKEIG